jgi:hypothetical protein
VIEKGLILNAFIEPMRHETGSCEPLTKEQFLDRIERFKSAHGPGPWVVPKHFADEIDAAGGWDAFWDKVAAQWRTPKGFAALPANWQLFFADLGIVPPSFENPDGNPKETSGLAMPPNV